MYDGLLCVYSLFHEYIASIQVSFVEFFVSFECVFVSFVCCNTITKAQVSLKYITSLLCMHRLQLCLFCAYIGLFCVYIGLCCVYMGAFCVLRYPREGAGFLYIYKFIFVYTLHTFRSLLSLFRSVLCVDVSLLCFSIPRPSTGLF